MRTIRAAAVVLVAGLGWSAAAPAATCTVPSTPHPDIQTAVDDVGCDPIQVAAGTYVESPVISRSVTVTGAGSDQTFILGPIEISSGQVHLGEMHVSAAGEALWAHSGAEISGFDLTVVSGVSSATIFADGFESGDTAAWDATAP